MSSHFFRSNIILKHIAGGRLTYREEFPGKLQNPVAILEIMMNYVKRTSPAYKIIRITTQEIGRNVK